MTAETWHYLVNQFDNATENSTKLMNIINVDHYAKLQAQNSDPQIATLVTRTTAPFNNFNGAYSAWLSAKGIYKGETNRVDNYLRDLASLKIKQWDIQIQGQFLDGTSDYIAILPNNRAPFQQGGIDQRISEVASLAERLLPYVALAATRTDVLAFHATISGARNLQQQKEELVANASDNLEVARKAIALMMYKNLGFLINKYNDTPDYISNFWELSLFRTPTGGDEPGEPINGTVPPASTVNIPIGVFTESTQFILRNTGSVTLLFCLKSNATDACVTGASVLPGEDATVSASDLGAAADTFLNCTNDSASVSGNFQVILVG